jgi:hypothetical protein
MEVTREIGYAQSLSVLEAEVARLKTEATENLLYAASLQAENDRLREALRDAIDGYQECAPYKGDYLYQKHGDEKEVARLKAALEGE